MTIPKIETSDDLDNFIESIGYDQNFHKYRTVIKEFIEQTDKEHNENTESTESNN